MPRVAVQTRPIAHAGPQPARSVPEHKNGTGLAVLVIWLVLFWAGLKFLVGWPPAFPALPSAWPSWPTIEVWLGSALLPTDWLIPSVGLMAWVIWGWTTVFVVVRLTLNGLEAATQGAAWVRSLVRATDWLMLPAVRRAVDASLAGLLVARVLTVPTTAAAQTITPIAAVVSHDSDIEGGHQLTVGPEAGVLLNDPTAADDSAQRSPRTVIHTVRLGETWTSISRQYFGTDDRAEQLLHENLGRAQPYGQKITRNGLIRQGYTVQVLDPTVDAAETDDNGDVQDVHRVTVQRGDTMWGISRRDLGDGARWPEIYQLSRGAVSPDGHVLTDPNVIWPGLELGEPTVPAGDQEADSPPSQEIDAAQKDDWPAEQLPAPEPPPPVDLVVAAPTAVDPAATLSSTATPVITAEPVPLTPATVPAFETTKAPEPAAPTAILPIDAPRTPWLPLVLDAAEASLAVGAVATGAALVLRRRHRARARTQPESDVAITAGFAEAELTDDLLQQGAAEDLSTASLITSRLSRALGYELQQRSGEGVGELPTEGTTVAGVRHGRSSTTLMLQQMPMAARAQVIGCLPDAATRAFGARSDVEGMVSRDGDVLVRLTGANQTSDAELDADLEAWPPPAMLLPLGVLADRQVFAANWDALGHILVASPLGQGAEAVLGALLASLVSRRFPSQLGLMIFDSAGALPDELLGVLHVLEPPVDPYDEQAAIEALMLVRAELDDRMATGDTHRPDIVVVLTELGQMSAEHLAALGPIMLHGPRYRVRVIAASVRRAVDLVQHCPLLPEFGTRLVLRTADEEESIALLGSDDATELGSGGHLLARLEGRVPLQVHGYRVAPDRLARMAALIRGSAEPVDWWRPQRQPADGELLRTPTSADPQWADEESTEIEPGASGPEESLFATTEGFDEKQVGEPKASDLEHDQAAQQPTSEAESNQASGDQQTSLVAHLQASGVEERASLSRDKPKVVTQPPGVLAEPRPRLRGRFFGGRDFLFDGKIIPYETPMELLVFLGVQDPSGARPAVLSDSIWSEDDDEDMRYDRVRKLRYRCSRALKRSIPDLDGDPIAPLEKQHPVYRLNPAVIESDVHRFLKLLHDVESLGPEDSVVAYEEALELYRGDLLERPDVPAYRWLDDGPRLVDLRVRFANMQRQARRHLADLLASGTGDRLDRAEELYIGLAEDDPLDHRLWEALARLHGRRNDLLGLEATVRRLRSALAELGEGEDLDKVPVPPTLERVFAEVRASLLPDRAA